MNRRRFFECWSTVLSGLSVLFLAVPGVVFLLDPLFRRAKQVRQHRLLKLSDLKPGLPRRVPITDQRNDAWTRYPQGPVGAVWLVLRDDKTVDAFSTTCPHLGCQVDYVSTDKTYFCPCHQAKFFIDGRTDVGPQKRGLDRLKVTVEKVGDDEWVGVVFERFETGISEKVPLG